MDWMPQAIRDGIFTVLFISGPLVLLAAALGLVIGIIQAATQVQEQTLGSAVKILGVFLALIIFGFYMFQYLKQYATQTISRAFNLVPSLSSHPLPPKKLFKQPIKSSEETDHPLFSPEELAETMPVPENTGSRGPSADNKAAVVEEPEVVEVVPPPSTDELPKINYLTRPPSGIKEAIFQTLTPESTEEAEQGLSQEPTSQEPTTTRTTATPTPTSRPAATRPSQTQQATTRPAAAPTTRPVQQQSQTAPAARPAASRPAPTRTTTTRPAARPAPRPQVVAPVEEPAPIVRNEAPQRNADLEASRNSRRAALARIKSSINEVEGAATAE